MSKKHGDIVDAATEEETLRRMLAKLAGIVPEDKIAAAAGLVFQINELKRERNAVVLGHNYMDPILYHTIADYVGDSLALASASTKTDAEIIVFCGVQFMAETGKILNPDRTVLIPVEKAGCSLAEGITAETARKLRAIYPGAPTVTYVNTYAAVKAECDYCCTSGNATAVLRHLFDQGHDRVVFIPDKYLARNTADKLGADFITAPPDLDNAPVNAGVKAGRRTIIGWPVLCEVHEQYTVEAIKQVRKDYPGVAIVAHAECSPEVVAMVDLVGSTKDMIDYVKNVDAPRYLLLTDSAMTENLAAEFPNREFVRACKQRCKYMESITLENTRDALEKNQYVIELDEDIIRRARLPIDRMLTIK